MDRGMGSRVGGIVATSAVSCCLLGAVWLGVTVLSFVFVEGLLAAAFGTLVTLVAAVGGLVYGRASGLFTVRVAASLLAIGGVTVAFLTAAFLVVGAGLVLVFPPLALEGAAAVTLALGLCCLGGVLAALRSVDHRTDWALTVRMVLVTVALALCAVGFVVATWTTTLLVSLLFGSPGIGVIAASLVTVGIVAGFGYIEYEQILTVEERADATPVAAEDYPELHARVTRIAAQLSVPAPTIALSRRRAPEAMVVGFRPSKTHLVLSTGLLDALDGDELDAVIAHELAHVANRDATVMTVVSAPAVITDGFLRWLRDDGSDSSEAGSQDFDDDPVGDHTELTEAELYGEDGEWAIGTPAAAESDSDDDDDDNPLFFLAPVAYISWGLSRTLVAILARSRETAADRVSAEVTGAPAALASALQTLDDRVEATPERDLRAAAGVSALSIVPLETDGGVAVTVDPTRDPGLLLRIRNRLFRTHPPTEERVELLTSLEGTQERD